MNNQRSATLLFGLLMRSALCLVLTGILVPFALLDPQEARAAEETVYVNVLVARVRQAPTTDAPIVFRIRRGDPVVVQKKQNQWYYIRYPDGRMGWAHQKLFTATAQDSAATTVPSHFIKSVTMKVVSRNRETVAFELDGFHPPETFVLKGDLPRVVCDFMNTRINDNIGDRIETKGALVRDIRVAPYGGVSARVRIVLDLSADGHYEIDQTFYKKENIYMVTVSTAVP